MNISKRKIDSLKAELDAVKGCVEDLEQITPEEKEQIIGSLVGLTKVLNQDMDATMFKVVATAYQGLKPTLDYAQQMEDIALKDRVTGLLSRAGMLEAGRRRLNYAQRNEHSIGVFFLDLNKFKPINDTLGHDEGDLALKLVGSKLQDTLRENDLIARYGGDEFVILIMNDDPNHQFEQEQIKLEQLFDGNVIYSGSDGKEYSIGTAIGFTTAAEGEEIEGTIKRADKIMYLNKQKDRDSRPPEIAPSLD